MSCLNSFIIEDRNQNSSMSSMCDNELFDGILSDVDSVEGSKTDQELIGYLKSSSDTYHGNTRSSNYEKSDSKCMSRNAIMARENRQKKKEYIQTLEKRVENLTAENSELKSKSEEMQGRVSDLVSEVEYLKGVIANQSTLSKLIGSVCSTPGVRFYSSFTLNNASEEENNSSVEKESKRKCSVFDEENQENATPSKTQRKSTRCIQPNKRYNVSNTKNNESPCQKIETKKNGICLHVSGDSVSLEFCSQCSKSASKLRGAAVTSASSVLREKVGKRKK